MKFSYFLIAVFFLMSCERKKTSIKDDEKINPIVVENINYDTTRYLSNDTICYTGLDTIRLKDIRVMKACHIFFSDSVSKRLMYQNMQSQFPEAYNIQIGENSEAFYTISGNIITVRFLFYNRIRDNRLFPDSIFLSKGILYLSEKEVRVNNRPKLRDQMMEEFFYVIQLKNSSKHVRIKHKLTTKIHG